MFRIFVELELHRGLGSERYEQVRNAVTDISQRLGSQLYTQC